MWTFPKILFLFFLSAMPSSWIVRSLVPWFWAHAVLRSDIIVPITTIPEIDNLVYISWFAVFVVLFLTFWFIAKTLHTRYRRMDAFIEIINRIFLIYFLIVPGIGPWTLDQIRLGYLIGAAGIVYLIPGKYIDILFGLVVFRYGIVSLLLFDVAPHPVMIVDHIFISIFLLFVGYVYAWYRVKKSFRSFVDVFVSRITRPRITVALILGMGLSLLSLMTMGSNAFDIYFTTVPTYQFLHGGTPFVSMTSLYGILYLLPWIAWMGIFPHIPITFQVGAVYAAILLFGYFGFFTLVSGNMFRNRFVFAATILAVYYFRILIWTYGYFYGVSIVLEPAFTPLRFGVFLFPLVFLLQYIKTNNERYFRRYLILCSVCFFFSFEIGAGILLAGIVIGCIEAFRLGDRVWHHTAKHIVTIGITLLACCLFFVVLALVRTGELPNFLWYIEFAIYIGSEQVTLPVGKDVIAFAPLGIAIFASLFGLRRIFYEKNIDGYIFVYLALNLLVEFPYYMGRSLSNTVYGISMPYIVLCGLITDYALRALKKNVHSIGSWIMIGVCGYTIAIGAIRGFVIVGNTVLHSAEIVDSAVVYTKNALTTWDIKTTSQYDFLRKKLPAGCSLLIFDGREYELLTASGLPPAFQYGMVNSYIVRKSQVDTLKPYSGYSRICVFVNTEFVVRDGLARSTYDYFWKKYGASAQVISTDEKQGFTLYTFPSSLFVAKSPDR
jgi:hypothetical protein